MMAHMVNLPQPLRGVLFHEGQVREQRFPLRIRDIARIRLPGRVHPRKLAPGLPISP